MEVAALQRCKQKALQVAAHLRLPLSRRVWKGQSGEYSGAGTGSSLDFQDQRHYMLGDDPRHINWNAYARTEMHTMKLYREEVRPVVDVIMDCSESMFYDAEKAARSAEILYLIIESTRRGGASLRVHLVKGASATEVPLEMLDRFAWYEKGQNLSSDSASPDLSRLALRTNAIRVFISDLLYPGSPLPTLRSLTAKQGSALIFTPYMKSEALPEWDGNYEFYDPEINVDSPQRIEKDVLEQYKKSYARHMSLWKQSAISHQALLSRVSADVDFQQALHAEALPSGALEAWS